MRAAFVLPSHMPGIFISYRRADSDGWAGRLRDALRVRFGDLVFQDVDNIADGEIFSDVIDRALRECDVALVIIGPNWASALDEQGRRRLDQEDDWVRTETAMVLNRRIRVIPVLVGGANVPRAEELPEELRSLTRRQAREIRSTSWDSDVALLSNHLRQIVGHRQKRSPWLYAAPAALVLAGVATFLGIRYLAPSSSDMTANSSATMTAPVAPPLRETPTPPPRAGAATEALDSAKRAATAELSRGVASTEPPPVSSAAQEKAVPAPAPRVAEAPKGEAPPPARVVEPPKREAPPPARVAEPSKREAPPVRVAEAPPREAPPARTSRRSEPEPPAPASIRADPVPVRPPPAAPAPQIATAPRAPAAAPEPRRAPVAPVEAEPAAVAPPATPKPPPTRTAVLHLPNKSPAARELKIGDSWTYRLREVLYGRNLAVVTHEIGGGDGSGIRETVRLGERAGGTVTERRLPLEPRMFEQSLDQTTTLYEFAPFMAAYSDLQPGMRWSSIAAGAHVEGGNDWRYSGKVAGRESVRVPAGSFEAIKAELEGQREIAFPTTRDVYNETVASYQQYAIWFVPEIGRAVKYERRTYNRARRLLEHERYELVSYRSK